MKTAAASVMSASASVPPMWNRMRKTSAFLRKLSLNAEKNWVQNRGAKRRVISRDEDMAQFFPVPVPQRHRFRGGGKSRAETAPPLKDDKSGKRTTAAVTG